MRKQWQNEEILVSMVYSDGIRSPETWSLQSGSDFIIIEPNIQQKDKEFLQNYDRIMKDIALFLCWVELFDVPQAPITPHCWNWWLRLQICFEWTNGDHSFGRSKSWHLFCNCYLWWIMFSLFFKVKVCDLIFFC